MLNAWSFAFTTLVCIWLNEISRTDTINNICPLTWMWVQFNAVSRRSFGLESTFIFLLIFCRLPVQNEEYCDSPLWPSPRNYSRPSESLCLFHLNVWHPRWPRHMGWQFGSEVQSNERGGWAVDAASDGLISYRRRGKNATKKTGLLEFITAGSHAQQHKFLLSRVWARKFKFTATRGSCACGLQTIWNWVNSACNIGLVLKHSVDVLSIIIFHYLQCGLLV